VPEASHGRWEPDFDADERTMLTGFLDYHRATLRWKVEGLTKAQMAQTTAASELTLAGLVKHLALVEDSWFTERFAGLPEPEPWAGVDWEADHDWELHSAVDDDPADLLALYDAACARSRAITDAAASLDQHHVGEGWDRGPLTLRWILLHMIEETARHNGHADLLREAIDGATGE
jgi:uncharacterized damage-inducible protein DinB